MIERYNAKMNNYYDTTINVIGGLKDIGFVYKSIETHFNEGDSLREMVSGRNEFGLRTERSRTRIEKAIEVGFLTFINQDHMKLIKSIFTAPYILIERELVLFWQFQELLYGKP